MKTQGKKQLLISPKDIETMIRAKECRAYVKKALDAQLAAAEKGAYKLAEDDQARLKEESNLFRKVLDIQPLDDRDNYLLKELFATTMLQLQLVGRYVPCSSYAGM